MSWHLFPFNELSTPKLYAILKLRVDIFVVEQNCPYPEIDGKDSLCYHLYKEIDGEIAAYARLLPPGLSYEEASIGRVIVNPKYRGQKLGESLLKEAIRHTQNLWNSSIQIGAQAHLQKFYSAQGFVPNSEIYLEDDIPHLDMLLNAKEQPLS